MITAKCIKETYTWEGDGKQHIFHKVKLGHYYQFEKVDGVYWIDINNSDFADSNGFIKCANRGLEEKYFNEMFQI